MSISLEAHCGLWMTNCCSCCCPCWISMCECSSGWCPTRVPRSCSRHGATGATCRWTCQRLISNKSQSVWWEMRVRVENVAQAEEILDIWRDTIHGHLRIPSHVALTDMHLRHVLLILESSAFREYKSQSQTASSVPPTRAWRAASNPSRPRADKIWARLSVPKPSESHLESLEYRAMIFHLCRPAARERVGEETKRLMNKLRIWFRV